MTSRGRAKRLCSTLPTNWRSIASVTSKSAITPWRSGRSAEIVAGRAADHPLRVGADGVHLAGALVDRDDRRLGQHDPAPAHVDDRVRGAEVDRHVADAAQCRGGPAAHRRETDRKTPRCELIASPGKHTRRV